jgi:hypothetical protein
MKKSPPILLLIAAVFFCFVWQLQPLMAQEADSAEELFGGAKRAVVSQYAGALARLYSSGEFSEYGANFQLADLRIRGGYTLPSSCAPNNRLQALFYKYANDSTAGLYRCQAGTNTYIQLGAGGGGNGSGVTPGLKGDINVVNADNEWRVAPQAVAITELSGVSINSPTTGQVLKFNGTNWVNDTDLNGGGGGSTVSASDEGVQLTSSATSFNFVGPGITATNSGSAVTVNVPGGITSFNGLTAAAAPSQTLAIGSAGSAPTWNSTGSTHTLNLPVASATNSGILSNSAFTLFNSKPSLSANSGFLPYSDGTNLIASPVFYNAGTDKVSINKPLDLAAELSVSGNIKGTSLIATAAASNGLAFFGAGGTLQSTSAPTDGQFLIGRTGNTPILGTLSAGTGITITPGAGTIQISATGGGGGGAATSFTGVASLAGSSSPGQVAFRTSDGRFFGSRIANQWSQFLQADDTVAVAQGGTGLTTAADDAVAVGNGTTNVSTVIPSCSNATTSKLLYNNSTNAFTCGTDQTGGGGSSIPVSDEGSQITAAATSFNFTGAGVTATNASGAVTVNIPGGAGAATDETVFSEKDDFGFSSGSELPWTYFSTAGSGSEDYAQSEPNRLGIRTITTGAAAGNDRVMFDQEDLASRIRWQDLAGMTLTWIFKLSAGTNTGAVIGFRNFLAGQYSPTDGCFARVNSAGSATNWEAVCRQGAAAETVQSLGVTNDTGWHKLKMTVNSATSVSFQMDGGSVVNITTNTPAATANVFKSFQLITNNAAAKTASVDYYRLHGTVTR